MDRPKDQYIGGPAKAISINTFWYTLSKTNKKYHNTSLPQIPRIFTIGQCYNRKSIKNFKKGNSDSTLRRSNYHSCKSLKKLSNNIEMSNCSKHELPPYIFNLQKSQK